MLPNFTMKGLRQKTVCIKTKRKLKGWIDVVLTLFKQKLARGGRAHGLEDRDRHGKKREY